MTARIHQPDPLDMPKGDISATWGRTEWSELEMHSSPKVLEQENGTHNPFPCFDPVDSVPAKPQLLS